MNNNEHRERASCPALLLQLVFPSLPNPPMYPTLAQCAPIFTLSKKCATAREGEEKEILLDRPITKQIT